MVFELVDGRIERGVGPFGRTVLAGYRAAVAGMARAGLDVIVDEVLLSAEDWDAIVRRRRSTATRTRLDHRGGRRRVLLVGSAAGVVDTGR
jgi:hypothetical protein